MDLGLKGKRALVMGASAGIGRAIAEELVHEGAEVVICARNSEKLEKTAKEIGCRGHFKCDLVLPGEGRRAVETALKLLGGLDILVTNSGGPKRGTFAEISDEQWNDDFQNLWMSVVESLKVALPKMKDQKFGRVVMITSLAAKEPRAGLTTSNGLRAGLAGLCKSISNEYAPFGVTLNLVLPGMTNTDRLKELALTSDKIAAMVPLGRLAEPSEIASAVCFLTSERAAYITGQSLVVDGGATKSP